MPTLALPADLPAGLLSPALLLAAACLTLAAAADLGLLILLVGLVWVFSRAPELGTRAELTPATSLTVVIPAYNEAANIEACLASVLDSSRPCEDWRVLVVDDRSTDPTAALAAATALRCGVQRCMSPPRRAARPGRSGCRDGGDDGEGSAAPWRFGLLDAGPRPGDERWVGKNWACSRAMEQVHSDWVLFLDADVRLQPDTLRRALGQASEERADLFSLAPRLSCGCLSERMVQPIMTCLLGLGFPIAAANDPADPTAFAAGPFMLFRRSAYEAIGGHRALAGEVVEDLALARRIKASGHRLRYLLGLDAVELRMYRDFASLWEGWSKNWFSGLDRSIGKALGASAVVLLMFSGPWLLSLAAGLGWLLHTLSNATGTVSRMPAAGLSGWGSLAGSVRTILAGEAGPDLQELTLSTALQATLLAALLGIGIQLILRLWIRRRFQMPLTLWWLMGAGGLVVAALGPTSVWRSLTGRGWTWKGRALAG